MENRQGFRFDDLRSVQPMTAHGLTTIESTYGPEETMNRFEAEVRARGMIAFARIDHTAGATAVGLSLRPTNLLIFGKPTDRPPLLKLFQTSHLRSPWNT